MSVIAVPMSLCGMSRPVFSSARRPAFGRLDLASRGAEQTSQALTPQQEKSRRRVRALAESVHALVRLGAVAVFLVFAPMSLLSSNGKSQPPHVQRSSVPTRPPASSKGFSPSAPRSENPSPNKKTPRLDIV